MSILTTVFYLLNITFKSTSTTDAGKMLALVYYDKKSFVTTITLRGRLRCHRVARTVD